MTAQARKRPIERSGEPGFAALFAGERGTTPLVAAVQKPDARNVEFGRYGLDLVRITRARLQEPASSGGVDCRQQPGCDARQPANALVTQRTRTHAAFGSVTKRASMPHVDNGNGGKSRGQCRAHSPSYTRT